MHVTFKQTYSLMERNVFSRASKRNLSRKPFNVHPNRVLRSRKKKTQQKWEKTLGLTTLREIKKGESSVGHREVKVSAERMTRPRNAWS